MRPIQFRLSALLWLLAALAYLMAFPVLRTLLGMFGTVLLAVAVLMLAQLPIFLYLRAGGRLPRASLESSDRRDESQRQSFGD